MKHSLTILLLLCSMAVITSCKSSKQYQSKNIWSVTTSPLPSVSKSPISHSMMFESDSLPTIGSGLKYEGGELMPTPGIMLNVQDTVKVIMLTTKETDINKPVQLMQIEGYSVTPKYVFNALTRAYYLNIHKQPMPDDVIVWMSIQR